MPDVYELYVCIANSDCSALLNTITSGSIRNLKLLYSYCLPCPNFPYYIYAGRISHVYVTQNNVQNTAI